MLVTLSGIVTPVSLLQPRNALSPMLVTLVGIEYSPVFPAGQHSKRVMSILNKTPSKLL